MKLLGLHHVSAITAAAAKNVDFYTQIMGLRLIKKTVNQDDVSVYHLFTEMSVELRVQKSLSLKFHMRDKLVQEITAFQHSPYGYRTTRHWITGKTALSSWM